MLLMIRRELLMATAIIASAIVLACSEMTAPKRSATESVPAASIRAPHAGPVTVVATINGGGTAEMQVPAGLLAGTTSWGGHITLYSDGTAKGEFHCVDQMGSTAPGNVWGPVTSWSIDANGVVSLTVGSGKLVNFPGGHPQDSGTFIVRIQRYGGKGVGHWTLDVPDGLGGWLTVCDELLTSGQIVYRPE
jgi:hypothetical protein